VNVSQIKPTLLFARYAGAAVATMCFNWPAHAELPPQYTIWQDFAAVTAQAAIPTTLGLAERIERMPDGKYQVRAGSCFVEVTVTREPAKGADGRPMPGPSRISKVDVSDKRCDR
jgi:hypothetical protein